MKQTLIIAFIRFTTIFLFVVSPLTTFAQYSPTPTAIPPTLPPPPNMALTCHSNNTATFQWGARAGATGYIFRLDNQGNGPTPVYDWLNTTTDRRDTLLSSQLQVTIPILTNGTRYQWGVSSVNGAGAGGNWIWSAEFTCPPPPATPTPYIQINTRNLAGTPVPVRGMSYTYNCAGWPLCFTVFAENVSSASIYARGNVQGGAGIALNSNQSVVSVSPSTGGGTYAARTNNGTGASTNWWDLATWYTYWWPTYPATGSRTVNYVVSTLRCNDSDGGNTPGTQGTTTAELSSGVVNSQTDTCGSTFITGSSTYRTTVTEYSCSPPSGGGSGTGTTRTSNSIPCGPGLGCVSGACSCIPMTAPGNLSPSGNVTPGNRTITWNAVPGATTYLLRIDDESNGWTGTCATINPGDVCNDNVTATSYTYNFIAGRSYNIWVHSDSPCAASSAASNVTAQTPYCVDTDSGNSPNTYGTTTEWTVGNPSTALFDSCSGTLVTGSQTMTSSVTEYSCQPPATGGSSTGTSRTGTTINCATGRSCFNGTCILPPDLTYDTTPPGSEVVRTCTGPTENITVNYCNNGTGNAPTGSTFRIRYRRTSPGPSADFFSPNLTVPAPGTCNSVVQSTAGLGVTCDDAMSIEVVLDPPNPPTQPGGSIPETNDITNNTFTFVGPALPGELFYKLKNASVHRRRAIDVPIPNPVTALDGDDTTEQLMIIGAAGVATSTQQRTRVISATGRVSTTDWHKDNTSSTYTESTGGFLQDIPRYIEYTRAQKRNQTITGMAGVGSTTINIFTGDLTISSQPTGITNSIILVQGNVNITAGPTFNTSGNSMAIIASGTITIDPSITTVNAILIANNVNLGASTTNRLKIKGNLISNTAINTANNSTTMRNVPGTQSPNLFIVVDPKMYMDLLPYLNEITLNGRQVE